jgi:hypothetical protein
MIVIYGIKEKLNPIKLKLSQVIHKSMQQILGMPEDKRAHRFIPMDKSDFFTLVDAQIVIQLLRLI